MTLGDTDTFTADSTSDAPDYSSERGPISDASVSSPRTRTNPITISQPQSQPRRNEFDQPTLDRAYHTIDFLQRNPQWLANPYTQHAANALLAGSSRMVEMSIQLERVNAMADSARLKLNTDTRLVNHLNDGLAKLKDMTSVAAIREEVQANGPTPLAISLLNNALEKEGILGGKTPTFRTLLDPVTGENVKVVYGPSGAPTIVHTQAEADTKAQAALQNKETPWVMSENILGEPKTQKMTPKAFAAGFASFPETARTNAANIAKLKSFGYDIPGASTNAPAASTQANITQEAYGNLKSGDSYWWNGKQLHKK